jgi:hypothetical protein
MTSHPNLAGDLAYMRDLAEAGENAPLLGGRFLAWWGGLMTLAYVGHFLIATGALGIGPEALWMWWLAFSGLGLVGQFAMQAFFPDKPGANSIGNRIQSTLWMGAGFLLFAFFAGVIVRAVLMDGTYDGFYWSVPLVIGLYGLGQFVTGQIVRSGALTFAGIAAFAGTAVAVVLSGTEYIWLAGAGAAFFAVFVPGALMLRREPSTTV